MKQEIKLMATKAGKGYKVVDENGKWFYTSKKELHLMLQGKRTACNFREIVEPAKA